MRRYGFGLAGLQVRIPSFCTASHWGPYPRLRPVPRCVVLLLLGAFQHFDAEPSKAVVWGSLEALCQVLVFRSPRFSWHLLDPIDLIIFRWCPIFVRFFHPISIFLTVIFHPFDLLFWCIHPLVQVAMSCSKVRSEGQA